MALQTRICQHFWNNNLPRKLWTEECPEFLKDSSAKDIGILSGKDEDFRILTWPEVQTLVDSNRIDKFQRLPSELRRYREYIFNLNENYGSVMNFIQQERLHWETINPSPGTTFDQPPNYRILYNDWPYAIDKQITHLVIWTKVFIEEDIETGDLTERARASIECFVRRLFCQTGGVPREDLVWFKNWRSLKSVHALEHIHVMLYRASSDFLDEITQADKPMCEV